jgi:uncharacterized integral membrane protein
MHWRADLIGGPGLSDGERQESTPPNDLDATEIGKTEGAPPPERVFVGTGLFWGLIVGLVLAVAVVILVAQNTGAVTIAFLGWDFSTSLIVVILGSLLIGVLLDELFGLVYRRRRRQTLRDREELNRLR